MDGGRHFAFLSDNLLLVLSNPQWDDRSEELELKVLELPEGTIRCTFRLPFLKEVNEAHFMRDNFQSNGDYYGHSCPYAYDPGNNRIIVLGVDLGTPTGHDLIYVVMSVSHLISHIPIKGNASCYYRLE